jgi:nucleoside-diphosphate-sugar epimerase
MNGSNKMALVLGATGGIGGEVGRQLQAAGWQVRAMARDLQRARRSGDAFEWVEGDALDGGQVLAAAQGCAVIVHAVNPPGYLRWADWVLPMLDNTVAAAEAVGARIVLPGTVYNFGPDALPEPGEDAPQHPRTRKGAIRVEMERRLREASTRGAKALVVRAGDFFGPRAGNSWFSQGLVMPGRPVRRVLRPGRRGIGHQWAYLPDVARTIVALLEHGERLQPFDCFHMEGHWDADGQQLIEAIRRVVRESGGSQPAVWALPWWLVRLAQPVVPLFREMAEMRYLWTTPLRMRNDRLQAVLGHEPHTPLDEAVRDTLLGLGCLPALTAPRASPPARESAGSPPPPAAAARSSAHVPRRA